MGEAKAVLSDPEARNFYDMYGEDGVTFHKGWKEAKPNEMLAQMGVGGIMCFCCTNVTCMIFLLLFPLFLCIKVTSTRPFLDQHLCANNPHATTLTASQPWCPFCAQSYPHPQGREQSGMALGPHLHPALGCRHHRDNYALHLVTLDQMPYCSQLLPHLCLSLSCNSLTIL